MGLFSGLQQRQKERAAARELARFQIDIEDWRKKNQIVDDMIAIVDDCIAGKVRDQFGDDSDYGFMLKKNEFAVAYLTNVGYIEIVRAPSQYSGGYGGVSFPIFGSVRLNTGRMGGSVTRGEENLTMTDEGNVMITDQRIMFAGSKRSHEWRFDKMLSVSHIDGGISVFAMNTGKPSGIGYGPPNEREIQFRIEIASALALDSMQRLRNELQKEKDKLTSEMPTEPPPSPTTTG